MKKIFVVNDKLYYFDSEIIDIFDVENYDSTELDVLTPFKSEENISEKITILLTTKCNANCLYCYEKNNYWIDIPNLLNRKKSIKICKKITQKYSRIKILSFFGGEPLLNFDELKYITYTLTKSVKVDSFEIITNGTIFNEEIIEFLKKFNFNITISLDGPAEIHNKLRKGTIHSKIISNINTLKKMNMINQINLNCTFTTYHEKKYSKSQIKNYFDKLGINYTINYENNLENYKYNSFELNIREIDNSLESLYLNCCKNISSYVEMFFDALIYRTYFTQFCPELSDNITETFLTDGQNTPCLSLMKFKDKKTLIKKINTKNFEPCNSCWAKKMCRKCIVNFFKNENYKNFKLEDCINEKCFSYLIKKYIYLFENNLNKLQIIIDNYCKSKC